MTLFTLDYNRHPLEALLCESEYKERKVDCLCTIYRGSRVKLFGSGVLLISDYMNTQGGGWRLEARPTVDGNPSACLSTSTLRVSGDSGV